MIIFVSKYSIIKLDYLRSNLGKYCRMIIVVVAIYETNGNYIISREYIIKQSSFTFTYFYTNYFILFVWKIYCRYFCMWSWCLEGVFFTEHACVVKTPIETLTGCKTYGASSNSHFNDFARNVFNYQRFQTFQGNLSSLQNCAIVFW